jgi:hypothetical protein
VATVAVELLHWEQMTDCRLFAPATGMNEIASVAIAKNGERTHKEQSLPEYQNDNLSV